jgi:hypothetical protein
MTKNRQKLQTGFIRIRVLDFPILRIFFSEFVSDFDIRISDFVSLALAERNFPDWFCQTFQREESDS